MKMKAKDMKAELEQINQHVSVNQKQVYEYRNNQ
jgi:hypothetical protein